MKLQISPILARAASLPVLPNDEQRALLVRAKAGDREARERLVKHNIRLVLSIAARVSGWEHIAEDLVQEGLRGLHDAIDRYDLRHRIGFGSYAYSWIAARMTERRLRDASLIKLGTTQAERAAFFHLSGAEPGDGTLAGDLLARMRAVHSLDMPTAEGLRLEGLLPDDAPLADEALEEHEDEVLLRRRVEAALARLSPREARIVRARYMSDERQTLMAMGAEMGISRERVRQIEARAKEKLRALLASEAA